MPGRWGDPGRLRFPRERPLSEPKMSETAHRPSNSFLVIRLLALHEFPAAADQGRPLPGRPHAIDPEDPELEPHDDEMLTRRGSWLRVRITSACPGMSAANGPAFRPRRKVITLLKRLPGRPAVERPGSAGDNLPPSEASAHGDVLRFRPPAGHPGDDRGRRPDRGPLPCREAELEPDSDSRTSRSSVDTGSGKGTLIRLLPRRTNSTRSPSATSSARRPPTARRWVC